MQNNEAVQKKYFLNFSEDIFIHDLLNCAKWQHSECVFTSFLVKKGQIAGLEVHLERLNKNLKFVYNVELDSLFCEKLKFLIKNNSKFNHFFKLRIDFFRPSIHESIKRFSDLAHLIEFTILTENNIYDKSTELCDEVFLLPENLFTNIKIPNYGLTNFLKNKLGGDFFVSDVNENILEATTSSFVLVINDLFIFPKISCQLDSVTRKILIEKFQEINLAHEIRDVSKLDLLNAQEIILLNSVRGIIPVKKFGNKILKSWKHERSCTFKVNTIYQSLFENI